MRPPGFSGATVWLEAIACSCVSAYRHLSDSPNLSCVSIQASMAIKKAAGVLAALVATLANLAGRYQGVKLVDGDSEIAA